MSSIKQLADRLRRSSTPAAGDGVSDDDLKRLALVSGSHDVLGEGQRQYHLDAEAGMEQQWQTLIWPLIKDADFSVVVDVAAGFGRNSAKLLPYAGQLIVTDINQKCIDACRQRFRGQPHVRFIKNDGRSLKEIAAESVTLVYSFDAMVHFDSDIVRAYLREFHRILKPGGRCFIHHSNDTERPGGGLVPPHSRNFMSVELFAHYSLKSGLEVTHQQVIDWGDFKNLDGLTMLRKP